MTKIDTLPQISGTVVKQTYTPQIHKEEANSFTDALKKLNQGKLKLSEKQTSHLGLAGVAFAANVMLFGEKLGLHKLGPFAPIIGGITLLAGSLGLLLCAETYGKKAGQKLAKIFDKSQAPTIATERKNIPQEKIAAVKDTSNNAKNNIPNADYKDIGLDITPN